MLVYLAVCGKDHIKGLVFLKCVDISCCSHPLTLQSTAHGDDSSEGMILFDAALWLSLHNGWFGSGILQAVQRF